VRILIDTNILIPLEDTCGILCDAYSDFAKVAIENKHQIIVHPGSIDDLQRDKNDNRKQTLLSKTKKYPVLESPPIPTDEKLIELGLSAKKDNDRIDNLILYAIFQSAAHILVTEDRKIHNKAKQLGISDKVHYVLQALTFLKNMHNVIEVKLPNISHVPLHNIDYKGSFFDSLRDSYLEFNDWYQEKSAEGRKAWCVMNKNDLSAILIYKEETDEQVTQDIILEGKNLKLCTFKVGEKVRGRKIGELMIKMAFEHAIRNKHRHVYLTIRPDVHDHLRDLCDEFGFYSIGLCKLNRDEVYVKEVPCIPPKRLLYSPFEYYKRYHPFFICNAVKKYIVPIIPKYHQILFPEAQERRQLSLFGDTTATGNTIKKAYLCHTPTKQMNEGDIVLFYRSTDKMAITTIGIVEKFKNSVDADEIATIVSKRTVYSRAEIDNMSEKETRIMLFRQVLHFKRPIGRKWLQENGIDGNIQSIRAIDDALFQKILKAENIQYAQ